MSEASPPAAPSSHCPLCHGGHLISGSQHATTWASVWQRWRRIKDSVICEYTEFNYRKCNLYCNFYSNLKLNLLMTYSISIYSVYCLFSMSDRVIFTNTIIHSTCNNLDVLLLFRVVIIQQSLQKRYSRSFMSLSFWEIVKPKSKVPKSKVPKSIPKGLGLTLKSHLLDQVDSKIKDMG